MTRMVEDGNAREARLSFRVIGDTERPSDLLAEAVAIVDSTPEPDLELIGSVGAGALETLVRNHGVELWEEIERLARENIRFRRALRSVWAYDSPEYERRNSLLAELGEWWPVEVRFVVEPSNLTDRTRLDWRAREVRGVIAPTELARILREIADNVERRPADGGTPPPPEGPIATVEDLAEVLVVEYGAEDIEIVAHPDRDDMYLILMALPHGPTMQSIVTATNGWALRTLRPVQHWLPYAEEPLSEHGVFTERETEATAEWRPATGAEVSRTTLSSGTFVSFWGVGRDEGLNRFRALRRCQT